MKKRAISGLICVGLLLVALSAVSVHAAVITGFTTAEGYDFGTTYWKHPKTLTSYTTANGTVDGTNFHAADTATAHANYYYGEQSTDPGSSAGLLENLDVMTGYVNIAGQTNYDFMFNAPYRFSSATGNPGNDDDFFVFEISPSDSPDNVTLQALDSSSSPLGSAVFLNQTAIPGDVIRFRAPNPAQTDMSGWGFDYDDFGVADATQIAGLRIYDSRSGGGFDPGVVGINNAIPEPGTLGLLGVAVAAMLLRRRRA